MTVYTVHEPNALEQNRLRQAERIAFVKEGFAWLAFLFPFVWLIYYRMWLELALFAAAVLAVDFGLRTLGVDNELIGWVSLALALIFAFEANELRRWSLDRSGYRLVAAATGKNREAAELSFFSHWLGRPKADGSSDRDPLPVETAQSGGVAQEPNEDERVIALS